MKTAILPRVAFLLIGLGLSLSGRMLADGFPLPVLNGGTWGEPPTKLLGDLQTALERSKFLDAVKAAGEIADQIGKGKVPAIDDLAGVVEGDVQHRVQEAVAQATDATQLLAKLDITALQQLFRTLQTTVTTPQEFAFTIPGGRLVFRRDLIDVSLCAVVAGPGGARVTLGMSNGPQLGGNPAERFANPTREPLLFADIALGYSNLQARRRLLAPPIPGPDPNLSIQATTYFKIHDQWVQLRFAGNDPESLSLKLQFVIGVRAGVSEEVQVEVEGQMKLEVEVNPTEVSGMLLKIADILKQGLGSGSTATLQADPAVVAPVLKQVFDYLRTVRDGGGKLGALSLVFAVDGGVGVGIAEDTGIDLASVGAQLTVGVPLDAVVTLSADLLANQLQAGLHASSQLVSLFEAMSEGRLDAAELAKQRGVIETNARQFGLALVGGYAGYIREIHLSVEAGVYALGDIGQVASQTLPLLVETVDIPVGQILLDGIQGVPRFVEGVTETAQAMAWMAEKTLSVGLEAAEPLKLGRIVTPPANPPNYVQRPRGAPPIPPTAAEWQAMAANLLDGVTVSLRVGAIGIEGASLGNLVRLAGGAVEVTDSLLLGAMQGAVTANEKPLLDALRAAPGQVRDETLELLIFNLQNLSVSLKPVLGGNGTVGVGALAGVGASIGFEANLKASLILLALGNTNYAEPDETLLAGFDVPLEASLSAGVRLGGPADLTLEGGFTAGKSLANLTLRDWGQDLPVPAGLSVAGFEVIDFVGTNRQDGVIVGGGWMVLPMGGLVRADRFSLANDGQVVDGRWTGVVELGPLGTVPVAGGSISNDGLAGTSDLAVGLNRLNAEFLLRSNGLLLGHATGRLGLAGLDLVADVRLDNEGFVGSGRTTILGSEFQSTNFRIRPNGTLEGSFSGTLAVDGQLLTLQKLEIHGNRLEGRTTLKVAGQPAVELLLTVDANGVIGTFVSDLNLFGAGSSRAWVRITDRIEVFGEMDGAFMDSFAKALREQLLSGISDARETLRREQEKLAARRADLEEFDRRLVSLEQDIRTARQSVRASLEGELAKADQKVRDADAELTKAINDLIRVSGQFAAELEKAEREFRAAGAVLATARSEVDKLRGQIAALDGWYNRLDPAGKFFKAAEYGVRRAALTIALGVAEPPLAVAQAGYNAALGALQAVQKKLTDADELRALKALKEEALDLARADYERIRREIEAISDDPSLDPAHIALTISRDAARRLAEASESVIALTLSALGDVAGVIDYLARNPESALVRIDRVHFRSQLAALDRGEAELIVEALVAGRPQRFAVHYNLKLGNAGENMVEAVRRLPSGLFPNPGWSVFPWTDDPSSGLNPALTAWAYHFNSDETASVGSVLVPGLPGISPAVDGRFSISGFVAAYPGDQNALTSGSDGSAILAANFLYGANPGTVTFHGLTPGVSYRAIFLSVGWDEAPITRSIDFSSSAGRLSVSQNTYGNNQGIRIEHVFVANATSHVVTLTPAATETFHLYALALNVESDSRVTFSDWNQLEFGARSFDPGVSGEDGDPDGDGLPNFLEYALRSDPQAKTPSAFVPPAPVLLPGSVEARRFTIPYRAGAGDVVYRLQQSRDLVAWTDVYRHHPAAGVSSQLPGVSGAADDGTQTLTVDITDPGLFAPPSFWRLVVEKP